MMWVTVPKLHGSDVQKRTRGSRVFLYKLCGGLLPSFLNKVANNTTANERQIGKNEQRTQAIAINSTLAHLNVAMGLVYEAVNGLSTLANDYRKSSERSLQACSIYKLRPTCPFGTTKFMTRELRMESGLDEI